MDPRRNPDPESLTPLQRHRKTPKRKMRPGESLPRPFLPKPDVDLSQDRQRLMAPRTAHFSFIMHRH